MGIRDFRNKLTHCIEMAKRGRAVIITDGGTPVAVMHNLDQIEEEGSDKVDALPCSFRWAKARPRPNQ